MPHSPAGLIWSAKPLASTRSPPCRPPLLTQAAGLIQLTTTSGALVWGMDLVGLAGLSGQRNRSTASMGAALTYARRYALFTLVGIAGEDDLDAPDLEAIAKADADQPSRPDGPDSNGPAPLPGLSRSRRRALPVALQGPFYLPSSLRWSGIVCLPNWTPCTPTMKQRVGRMEPDIKKYTDSRGRQTCRSGFQVKLAAFSNQQPGSSLTTRKTRLRQD